MKSTLRTRTVEQPVVNSSACAAPASVPQRAEAVQRTPGKFINRHGSSLELPRIRGIHFRVIGRWRRSVFQQFSGDIELADCCTCFIEWVWPGGFQITRRLDCPIDEHKVAARQEAT